MTTVSLLTPPGPGAIAVLELRGSDAWNVLHKCFQPVGNRSFPENPVIGRIWFGTIGDEVVVVVKQIEPEWIVEIHCHGGVHVVRWLINTCVDFGVINKSSEDITLNPVALARTIRTASILLDQERGAFRSGLARCLASRSHEMLQRMAQFIPVGRHLIEPWTVLIAGPPNVGKSSLINALAGYQRSVVSPIAGTTRDLVSTQLAFEGWPVQLVDSAGLRHADESLEGQGVERARELMKRADLVVWLIDANADEPVWPEQEACLVVVNKADDPRSQRLDPSFMRVSALRGDGVPGLIRSIVDRLVPVEPQAGEGIPVTEEQISLVQSAIREPGNCWSLIRRYLDS